MAPQEPPDPATRPPGTSLRPDTAENVPAPAAGQEPDPGEPPSMTIDEYAAHLTDIWTQVAEASGELAANVTDTWWKALPISRPEGLDMAGSAAAMAARLSMLGPDGNPLELLTMGLIGYAQYAQAQALGEIAHIEQQRQALHEGDQ